MRDMYHYSSLAHQDTRGSMEGVMKKLLSIAFAAIVLSLSSAPVFARHHGPNSGYCPAGTHAKNGGAYANNVKNCA